MRWRRYIVESDELLSAFLKLESTLLHPARSQVGTPDFARYRSRSHAPAMSRKMDSLATPSLEVLVSPVGVTTLPLLSMSTARFGWQPNTYQTWPAHYWLIGALTSLAFSPDKDLNYWQGLGITRRDASGLLLGLTLVDRSVLHGRGPAVHHETHLAKSRRAESWFAGGFDMNNIQRPRLDRWLHRCVREVRVGRNWKRSVLRASFCSSRVGTGEHSHVKVPSMS